MSRLLWIHVDFERVEKITERAILFIVEGEEVWIPKKCIAPSDRDQYTEGDVNGSVSISESIAEEKGLA